MRYNTSCPAGRPSSNALAVKSLSGSASTKTALRIVLKLSLVATSTSMRDGLSARAQTIAESTETSPDWTPWVITGRSAVRLNAGLAMPPAAAIAADEATVVKKRRRVSDAPLRMTAIGPPPSNHRGRKLPASSDKDSTLVRQLREDLAARPDGEAQARLALMCLSLPKTLSI